MGYFVFQKLDWAAPTNRAGALLLTSTLVVDVRLRGNPRHGWHDGRRPDAAATHAIAILVSDMAPHLSAPLADCAAIAVAALAVPAVQPIVFTAAVNSRAGCASPPSALSPPELRSAELAPLIVCQIIGFISG